MSRTALVLVDIQNDYFPGGKLELVGAEAAGGAAGRLLAAARAAGLPVVHIQHEMVRPGANFFLPGSEGGKIHASVAPQPGETVFAKHFPSSFRETPLRAHLEGLGVKRLIVAGMMSHMCVDATVRAAFDLGYECIVAHDACATRTLTWNGVEVPAAQVHAVIMAALAWVYGRIISADEIVGEIAAGAHS